MPGAPIKSGVLSSFPRPSGLFVSHLVSHQDSPRTFARAFVTLMAMAQKDTAVVVVSKEWMNSGVHHVANESRLSESDGDTHLFIAPLEDALDHRGLWLRDVKSTRLTEDASSVTMKFLIPWQFILAVGLIEEGSKVPMGFMSLSKEA